MCTFSRHLRQIMGHPRFEGVKIVVIEEAIFWAPVPARISYGEEAVRIEQPTDITRTCVSPQIQHIRLGFKYCRGGQGGLNFGEGCLCSAQSTSLVPLLHRYVSSSNSLCCVTRQKLMSRGFFLVWAKIPSTVSSTSGKQVNMPIGRK